MAKVRIADYEVQKDDNIIILAGKHSPESILLVTNVTDGIIIYNFANPALGASCVFTEEINSTVLTLDYDMSAMSDADNYQIFVDKLQGTVDLAEPLIDPVNKIRVSTPQNLIDTDFEYGLQSSKWETLELVNNIPSFYPTQADTALVEIVSVSTLLNSNLITVTTEAEHGLSVGTPIDIRGLSSQTAEGKYLIFAVPTTTTFTYQAKSTQNSTGTISGSYTAIVPGEFYSSSNLNYKTDTGITSDAQSPSALTVAAAYVHGLENGTNVYLVNSVASRLFTTSFTATATAPDGRPYVDPDDTLSQLVTSTSSLNETKEMQGLYSYKFNGTNVDIEANQILWPNNNLTAGDALLYVPPAGDTEIGGLQRFQIYYVKSATSSGITLCETTNGNFANNATIDITNIGTYIFGRAELVLAYELSAMRRGSNSYEVNCYQVCVAYKRGRCSAYQTYCETVYASTATTYIETRAYNNSGVGSGRDLMNTAATNASNTGTFGRWGLSGKEPQYYVLAGKTTGLPATTVWDGLTYSSSYNSNFTFNKAGPDPDGYDFVEDWSRFSLGGIHTASDASNRMLGSTGGLYEIGNVGTGSYVNQTSVPAGYAESFTTGTRFLIPLQFDSERDTIYTPAHGLLSGTAITLATTSGTAPVVQAAATSVTSAPSFTTLSNPASITITAVTSDRIKVRVSNTEQRVKTLNGIYSFAAAIDNPTRNSIYIASHGLSFGQSSSFSAGAGGTRPTLSTTAPKPTKDGDLAVSVYTAVTQALTTIRGNMGADAVNLYMNGTSPKQPFSSAEYTFSTGTYGFSYGLDSVTVNVDNNFFNSTIALPSSNSWSQGQAYNYLSSTSLNDKGYNLVQTPFSSLRETPYFVTVFETPNPNNVGGLNSEVYGNFITSVSNMAYTVQQTNNTNSTGSFTALSGGWRYTFDGSYYRPSTSASGRHGFFRLSMIIDNSNFDGYISSYSTSITPSGALGDTISGSGGQRYHVHILIPVKAGSNVNGTDYGLTSGTKANLNGIASSIASKIVTNIVAASYGAGSAALVKIKPISGDRFVLLNTDGIPYDFTSNGTSPFLIDLGVSLGALDGSHLVTNATSYDFKLNVPYKVPSRPMVFANTEVSQLGEITYFNIPDHKLDFGQAVLFKDNTSNFTGLTNNTTYYAIPRDKNYVSIASNKSNALLGVSLNPSVPGSGSYSFEVTSVNGLTSGPGAVNITSGSKSVTGDINVLFKQYFKTGDKLFVNDNSTAPGRIYTLEIGSIVSDTRLNLISEAPFTASGTEYFVRTAIYVRPDGTFQHRPFDGGVEITCGQSPNSKIIRQTRKYFRYQSGKGIQCSVAINFNPSRMFKTVEASGTTATVTTFYPHGIATGDEINVYNSSDNKYNGRFPVTKVDDFIMTYTLASVPSTSKPDGTIEYSPVGWTDSAVRCGMFDDQNGFFYEFNGQTLYAVRRSSVQQLSGTCGIEYNSNVITGTDTNFSGQIETGDYIVVRGQSYRVTAVENATALHIQPTYRGKSQSGVVITKTIDIKVPQSEWNVDRADGTGQTGFNLDITKIQMAYMDYSWYGAGKIRFGFKDDKGRVSYFHEFIHNNKNFESYMRSGNLPARYEIENQGAPSYVPSLFHWGTSVIMDGRFDDDKAYLFTATGNNLIYTTGVPDSATTTGASSLVNFAIQSKRSRDYYVKIPFGTSDASKFNANIPLYGTGLNGQAVNYTDYSGGAFNVYLYIGRFSSAPSSNAYPIVSSGTTVSIGAPAGGSSVDLNLLKSPLPIVSIRLAPSVDNNLTGLLGERDIINRMQLQLKQLGLTLSHDCNIQLILNGSLSTNNYKTVQAPSLSQLIQHEKADTIVGGIPLFSFAASGGTQDSTGKRLSNTIDFDLSEITDLGNCILGGDGVFPNGPDLLTIAAQVVDTAEVTNAASFKINGRLTWTESQA